ncbi:hypothetical protein ERJ70_06930 [Sediminibacillus dalangtanensis]|uniref:Glycosyl hydrolase n=1 Tax=Sediminibacillus dalangtanensis TaxID=2729421 RepID=A0ABX7VXL6_9BACI|nr:hypothetical protein [Sediminibacillus dalangtanensis]QTM99057.1 hypothetical protein ERJ70_06930 [Sediminibacillus dalangtanensis]
MQKKTILFTIMNLLLFLLPTQVFAHGTDETSNSGLSIWTYGLLGAMIILLVVATLFILSSMKLTKLNVKKKEERILHQKKSKQKNIFKWTTIGAMILSIFFLIMVNTSQDEEITFTHIHGIGYTNDGEEILVPSHDGLRIYKDGHWTKPTDSEEHDFMGFSMYKDGFYSSGHPDPNTNLKNPLGIIKSTDKGKNMEILDLYGEVDFHGMTAGYETKDIYVFNPQENSRMDGPGIYYSTDETKTWTKSTLSGIEGQTSTLAAHPSETGIVAIGTGEGVFLSSDYGDQFEEVLDLGKVSAVTFDFNNRLLVGVQSDEIQLMRIDLNSKETTNLNFPILEGDAISYIQQNPVDNQEIVVATVNKDIYFTHDGGVTWEESVNEGKANSH